MPKTACNFKGCKKLIEYGQGGRCEEHRREGHRKYNNDNRDRTYAPVYANKRWKVTRKQVMYRDGGWCVMCGEAPATEIDHIVELSKGGAAYDMDNLQALCHSCHMKKTADERKKAD